MLRISEMESGTGTVVLKLEGRLVGPWVDELYRAYEKYSGRNDPVELNLADVSYVDRKGVTLLQSLKLRNVRFHGCSPFVEEELKERGEAG
jgi:ABC-type transporter Mla MlaB component